MASIKHRTSGSVLGTIRAAQIVDTKPFIPAEIISAIMDHLAAPDLIRCARASRNLRDMVYDDSRWVQRLRAMGCWNEAAARARGQNAEKRGSVGTAAREHNSQLSKPNASASLLMFHEKAQSGSRSNIFETIPLSPIDAELGPSEPNNPALAIMSSVRSIRGISRTEYGRVHAVLWPLYNDALQSRVPSNARLFRAYRRPNEQARMLAQILRFGNADTSLGRSSRQSALSAVSLAFENAVSREFEQGMAVGDVDGRMKKYAQVLITLNGGQRAVDHFISANSLFGQIFGDPMDCVSPTDANALFSAESNAFFGSLSASLNAQLETAARVFPSSINVANPLIHKVVAEIVGPYLSTLFDHTCQSKSDIFLRAFSETYRQCHLFQRSLRLADHGLSTFAKSHLEDAVDSKYEVYFGRYCREELLIFEQRSEREVEEWEQQLSQQQISMKPLSRADVGRQAAKKDFLSSFKNVILAPVNALPTLTWTGSVTAKAPNGDNSRGHTPIPGLRSSTRPHMPMNANRDSPTTKEPPNTLSSGHEKEPVNDLAAKAAVMKSRLEHIRSLFSLELALGLIQMAKTSIERIAVFAHDSELFSAAARSQSEAVFGLLVNTLGSRHVRTGFDQAVEHLSSPGPFHLVDRNEESSVSPLMVFLELVNVCDLIQQMLDVFYEQELVAAHLVDPGDFLSPATKDKKKFEEMLDSRVALGLNKGIEVLINHAEWMCTTIQQVEDYNPGASGSSNIEIADISPTTASQRVVEILSTSTRTLQGSADKTVLDVFNQEIGLRLFNLLCKHLKRQRISVTGSIRLISDINHYFAFIQTFKNKELLLYFKALRELSQLYLIGPGDAKELAAFIADGDRFGGIFKAEEVYEFAERRADWYQIKAKVEKAMYGIGCTLM